MFQIKAKLVYNKKVKGNYLHCVLKAPKISPGASPGQFVNIKLNNTFEPLLRRPFSIHRVSSSNIEILYEAVGPGTAILKEKKPQEYLDVIGSLGNGFDWQSRGHQSPVLVAGGMGVAPLFFLAERITSHKVTRSVRSEAQPPRRGQGRCEAKRSLLEGDKVIVLIGARTKGQILCEKEFKRLGCDVKIATDDGSRGSQGTVTDLLKHLLSTMNYEPSTIYIYACGPRPMLKEVAAISKRNNIPSQVSLEEHMACGIGACLGCVVNTTAGYKRVCKDGPVFDAQEIIWSNEDTTYGMKWRKLCV